MRRLALITGASAGIGAALARVYAAQGFDLALTARRVDRLEALAGELAAAHGAKAFALAGDLADPATPAALLAAIEARGRQVDVLVNNAGYGLGGSFRNAPWPEHAAFIQVMMTAPVELARRALDGMIARRYGRILNVASVAGLLPSGPGHTLYGGAKSFLIRFSQALNLESEGTGVHVTALCPGLTYSEFHDVNGTRAKVSRLPGFLWQSAEAVAEIGFRACEANQAIAVCGVANHALAGLARLLPDEAATAALRRSGARRT